jgi:cytidylate kinase
VIFPDADIKIFVTAGAEVRAGRRAAELERAGEGMDLTEVLNDIRRRDARDSRRAAAPLKPAPDAHLLDTTHLDIDAAFRAAVEIVDAVRAGRNCG